MATRITAMFRIIKDYTQTEENFLAIDIAGKRYGYEIIYNTTIKKFRIWNETQFIS